MISKESIERWRKRSCEGKVPFTSTRHARKSLKFLKDNRAGKKEGLEIYRCLFGAHYHLGHAVPNALRKQIREALEGE